MVCRRASEATIVNSLRLEHIEEVAVGLSNELAAEASGTDAVWQVVGPPTAGKTALLEGLAPHLEKKGLWPLLMSPPAGHLDAAAVGLLQLGVALRRAGALNGELQSFAEQHAPWETKYHTVRDWLNRSEVQEKAVLLCDDPFSWRTKTGDDGLWSHMNAVVELVLREAKCRRVFTGQLDETVSVRSITQLRPRASVKGWLDDPGAWGPLSEVARVLSAESGLESRSPLEIRLLVAHAALSGIERATTLKYQSRRAISRALTEALDSEHLHLRHVWAELALVRRPFAPSLLENIGIEKLTNCERAILEHCLLYPRGAGLVLHEMLRADAFAADWLSDSEQQTGHRRVLAYYAKEFENAKATGDTATALITEAECFHHAVSAGSDVLHKYRPFFADQLDAWGRAVSLRARDTSSRATRIDRYNKAATIFARAVEWDPKDDYAHHYWAFNLDAIGHSPEIVAREYQTAIELAAHKPWWHARYVNLLIVLGKPLEARRAWDEALDALALPDESIYQNLHLWVARLLLHRGHLQFAQDVLDSVPAVVRQAHPGFSAMCHRLEALRIARDEGAFVPAMFLSADWWRRGPFLLERELAHGQTLARWFAARVDEVRDKTIHLRVAIINAGQADRPPIGRVSIPFQQFVLMTRDEAPGDMRPGRFLEIGVYATSGRKMTTQERIRVHKEIAWRTEALPPLFPDPTRYLQA